MGPVVSVKDTDVICTFILVYVKNKQREILAFNYLGFFVSYVPLGDVLILNLFYFTSYY